MKKFTLLLFFLLCFANVVIAETIKINVYSSYSLIEVVKAAVADFRQTYLANTSDKKIDFDFYFFANSNSMLLSKITKDNQNFDLFFCDSEEISKMALQQNLIHQRYAFLSDSIWVVSSKNLEKIPQNLEDLQDFHIHRILVSQSTDNQVFSYLNKVFQQTENYKIWGVLQDQQKKIFYTNSVQQNLELLANNQAEVSFVLLSEIMRFVDKDKLQLAFEFNLGDSVINYFSSVNANKDYQKDDITKQQYEILQSFLDYLRNPENKYHENFVKIYGNYGYKAVKPEELKVQF